MTERQEGVQQQIAQADDGSPQHGNEDAGFDRLQGANTQRSMAAELKQVPIVFASNNPNNSARGVVVTWEGPTEGCDVSQFHVYLQFDGKKKTETHTVDARKEKKVVFKELKSNTKYKAYVTPVCKDKEGVTAESEVVETDKAQRSHNFAIEVEGRPLITVSQQKKGDEILGEFKWNLPDLGIDGVNYKIVSEEPMIKEDGKKVELDFQNRHTKGAKLNWGKLYVFTVICKYLDLDDGKEYKAKADKKLLADIGEHSTDNVTWNNKEVTLHWSKAKGAKKHSLIATDEKGKVVLEPKLVKQSPFITKREKFPHGGTYKFVLEAFNDADEKRSVKKEIFLGGEKTVTNVTAKGDRLNPRRRLVVTWQAPKIPCYQYQLTLYDWNSSRESSKPVQDHTVQGSEVTHKFYDLKTSNTYCVGVSPIYDGKQCEGTLSNIIQTEKRIDPTFQKKTEFGLPQVMHTVKHSSEAESVVKVSWPSVQLTENFKVTSYHVTCDQQSTGFIEWLSQIGSDSICDKEVSPDKKEIELHLKAGLKYVVKVSAVIMDLDSLKKIERQKYHEIWTDPRKTVINDCDWKDGIINFHWEPVDGAITYRLVVKDELLHKNLIEDKNFNAETLGKQCVAELPMSENLKIGRTCMTKVHVYSAGERTSETDWKSQVLGGPKVPRNVKALNYSENPKRSVLITFDSPLDGFASEYKIVAIPESGLRKTTFCKTSNFVMEYLRKGVKYTFEVHAKWESCWSEGSPSNTISTEGDKPAPLMNMERMYNTSVDMTNAVLTGKSAGINIILGKDFGQVEDLKPKVDNDHIKDILTLKWNAPNFGNNTADHKVELYKVEICKQNHSEGKIQQVKFEKNRTEYQSEKTELELGEIYRATVSTIYLDIDQDHVFKSTAVETKIITRPCVPRRVKSHWGNGKLKIEWNAVRGAQHYELEIFANDEEQAICSKDVGKETVYEKNFDESFGYGTSYYVVVAAFSAPGISNSTRTEVQTIGGDHVATNVRAISNHEEVTDPSKQVFLKWYAPKKTPKQYQITSFPNDVEIVTVDAVCTECLMSGLKAGTEYYFQVKAIYEGKHTASGGCCSERIATTPTPTQVKHVWTTLDENSSSSVQISWEEVDAEREDETTKYKIRVEKEDLTSKRELYVTVQTVLLHDLDPGSTFLTTVAAGNSKGYGKDSEKVKFTTELGTPKDVILENNEENLCSSLTISFSNAEGKPDYYKAVLYKRTNGVEEPIGKPTVVEPGYTFNDLEANREYLVELCAQFESQRCIRDGRAVKSRISMTAPSKTVITEHRCDKMANGELNPRQIFAKWTSDEGCNVHEIKVMIGPTGTVESQLILENKSQLNYSCMHESVLYSIQVRSRNKSKHFGEWSDKAFINLVPGKLRGVSATLEENGRDILIQCNAALTDLPRYFMQTVSNGEELGKPKESCEKNNKTVKWRFSPPECAQVYWFKVWAENDGKIGGEKTPTSTVISRPSNMIFRSLKLHENHKSTDILIEWKKVRRCDTYEIKIQGYGEKEPENIARTHRNSYHYRCLVPGQKYLVSGRAIREDTKGEWSDGQMVFLAPAEVSFLNDLNSGNDPVNCVEVKWEPLSITPSGYQLKLFRNEVEVDEVVTTDTSHKFSKKLTPGSLCFCTVAALNDEKVIGKLSKSSTFRIQWLQASNFIIEKDENDPSHRAIMKWDAPSGVNCFRIEIENKQNGVITPIYCSTPRYNFESGIPINTYSVRLYCGCDEKFDQKYQLELMTMNPDPPSDLKVTVYSKVKGLTVEINDISSTRKQYEVSAEGLFNPKDFRRKLLSKRSVTLRNLVPGESYKISVCTIVGSSRSVEVASEGYIPTVPAGVVNLRSKIENDNILFEWDELQIKPTGYIIQWRVDNGPITEENTETSYFKIILLQPAHCYSARVMAANSSGNGPKSDWKSIMTDPDPPSDLRVTANGQVNGLTIKFNDTFSIRKRYEVAVRGLVNPKDFREEVVGQHSTTLRDLVPGESYKVSVCTVIGSSRSIEVATEEYTPTVPAAVVNLRSRIDHGNLLFEWDEPDIKPANYVVQWRVDNEPITEENTQNGIVHDIFFETSTLLQCESNGCQQCRQWTNFQLE